MRLLLVRHGETVDNVAGNFAGVTDSALTAHGVLQAERLGAHLATRFPSRVRAIFTSDLQRASRTGRAIRTAQQATQDGDAGNGVVPLPPLTETPLLRERDFGPLEGVSFRTCDVNPDDVAESNASMRRRAERFVTEVLLPSMLSSTSHTDGDEDDEEEQVVVVVAHGLLLPKIYAAISARVPGDELTFDSAVLARKRPGATPLQPWWSNTAYLEFLVTLTTSSSVATTTVASLHVVCVNCTVHLADLKRTRGGIGSAPHDDTQRKIQSYFGGKKL